MIEKCKKPSLNVLNRYSLKANILDDTSLMSWFADVCAGRNPDAEISEEELALMEGHGLVRRNEFGWVLRAEGRQFARDLGLIPGPSTLETDSSLTKNAEPKESTQLMGKGKKKQSLQFLWEQFYKTGDAYFRNLLMEHYRFLVKYAAERLRSKLPEKVEPDDLISAGIFGLMDAIDAFDPTRGVKFEVYCLPRVKGAILDELRSMDWVPRLVRERARERAHQLKQEEGEKDLREINVIKDKKSSEPLIEALKQDLKNLLTKGLTRAERLIVVLYYYEEMTMKEIGEQLDLPESRVSQMHSSIIARLKAQLKNRGKEELTSEQ